MIARMLTRIYVGFVVALVLMIFMSIGINMIKGPRLTTHFNCDA